MCKNCDKSGKVTAREAEEFASIRTGSHVQQTQKGIHMSGKVLWASIESTLDYFGVLKEREAVAELLLNAHRSNLAFPIESSDAKVQILNGMIRFFRDRLAIVHYGRVA